MLLIILDTFPDEAIVLNSDELLRHRQVLRFQVTLKTDKLGAHGAILTLLQLIFLLVEDLVIGLPKVLTEQWDCVVACLVVVSQQVHTKLVVDVFCDRLTLIVLLCRFVAMRVLLDALGD